MESKNEENFFTVEIAQDTLDRIIGFINACDTNFWYYNNNYFYWKYKYH